jgi:PadR family transcriptional regulator PadR
MKPTENLQAQMRKGLLELCLLSILRHQDAYSADLIDKLKTSNMLVVEGTLYPLLTRMKNDGLLSYEWQESQQGPPRKYYKITTQGEIFWQELSRAWKELEKTVNILLAL